MKEHGLLRVKTDAWAGKNPTWLASEGPELRSPDPDAEVPPDPDAVALTELETRERNLLRHEHLGDAALELQPLPRVPMVCVLWQADEEFPGRASFLFDSTAASQLPLDVILDLTHRTVDRLTDRG